MSTPFLFILSCLVSFRISWFITKDTFPAMRKIREFFLAQQRKSKTIVRTDEEGHEDPRGEYSELRGPWSWPAELITCFWCVSVWVSGILTFAMSHYIPYDWLWFGGVAAGSAIISQMVYKLTE